MGYFSGLVNIILHGISMVDIDQFNKLKSLNFIKIPFRITFLRKLVITYGRSLISHDKNTNGNPSTAL